MAVLEDYARILDMNDADDSAPLAAKQALGELIDAAAEIMCEVRDRSAGKAKLRLALARVRGEQ